jgi:arylsulfatase A-like enzyme
MKQFLAIIFITYFIVGCTEKKESKAIEVSQDLPNIIWLVAEDQSPEWFPMYGDTTISLPNLAALANDGVKFTNAVAPVPVCAPARSALITGMYPSTLGTHNMRTYAPSRGENNKPYPNLDIPSYSPIVPDGVKMFTEYLRKKGYYCSNGPKEDYNFKKLVSAWDESSKEHHWRKRKGDQPFFSVFNFSVCHESQIWSRGKDSLFVDPSNVPVPPYFPDNDTIRHDIAVNYSNLKRLDNQIGDVIAELKEDGLYDNSIIFFYGDHGGPFPRHKRALYDTGLKVPLVIKFPENKNAGSTDERLISFIDYAPTVLSLAGVKPPKVMQGKAQFGHYGSTEKSKYTFHSSDRFDGLYDRLRAVRNQRYKYIRSYDTSISHAIPNKYRQQMPMMRELRRLNAEGALDEKQSLWLAPTKPKEELYDLKRDPYELNNLAHKPELQDTLAMFRQELKNWIAETHDLGEYPEQELVENWLPERRQPQLPPMEMDATSDGIALIPGRADATILWKKPKDSVWNLYLEPLPRDAPFMAKTERIGYTDSEVLEYSSN